MEILSAETQEILDRIGLIRDQRRKGLPNYHWFVTGYGYCGSGSLDIVDLDHVIRSGLLPDEKFIVLEEEGFKFSGGLGVPSGDLIKPKVVPFVRFVVSKKDIFVLKHEAPQGGEKMRIGGHPVIGMNVTDLADAW